MEVYWKSFVTNDMLTVIPYSNEIKLIQNVGVWKYSGTSNTQQAGITYLQNTPVANSLKGNLLNFFFNYGVTTSKPVRLNRNPLISLLNDFPRFYSFVTGQPHKIDPTGQVADINNRFGVSHFLPDQFPALHI